MENEKNKKKSQWMRILGVFWRWVVGWITEAADGLTHMRRSA